MLVLPVGRLIRRPATSRVFVLLLLFCVVTTLVWRHRQLHQPTEHQCGLPPFCRSGMVASVLPPMTSDDLTLTRRLVTYLTSPDPAACHRLAKFGGTAKLREDRIPVLDGQKSVCMDGEFSSLFEGDCLIYVVQDEPNLGLDRDIAELGCQVEHVASRPGDGSVGGALSADLTSGHHGDRVISLLAVTAGGGRGLSLLRSLLERGAESPLGRAVRQMVIRIDFLRHLPVSEHTIFYRNLYSTVLQLQSLGFYPFANEPNYLTEANVTVPGLEGAIHPSMDVAWIKTECFPPVTC